ncbi:MAG: ABC transporter ATP-binding protein [Synergistaceae bacterium]|jgi:oligopeptide/dipeptide ABC transporter ATP-binding protein|nr:ABC transporter ATP-binding protein [Synergistaceae bacterium]
MAKNKVLEITDLVTRFFTKEGTVHAVNGVSFSIYEGEIFGLVGESGCGKSVTCKSIINLLHPPGQIVSGSIKYAGQELVGVDENALSDIRGREIGMIFQEPLTALNPVLTIREQIFDALEKKGMTSGEKYARAAELLTLAGIPAPVERMEEYPHQFSGGMRQRVMIAIALASEPKILLADEPTTALDVTIQDQILKLIDQLREELGMAVLFVTHDLGVVAQLCDRVAVMYAGYIMELTATLTLFAAPRHPYTHALLQSLPSDIPRGHPLESIGGQPPDLFELPPGCPFSPRCRMAEGRCFESLPPLTELLPGHFVRCHRSGETENFRGIIDL